MAVTHVCGGCASGSIQSRLELIAARPETAAVLFFVDGMDQSHLDASLAAGRLVNIDRYFVRGGVAAPRMIVSLPPITYVNAASLLTGCFPARHGIYGNRWFDRETLEYRDYTTAATFRDINEDIRVPTIYERLGDVLTVNVQCHTRRGARASLDNTVSNGIDWWLGAYEAVDRRAGATLSEVAALAKMHGRWPALTTFYFPGLDEIGHRYGPDSQRYADALVSIDEQIGRVIEALEADPPANRLYFALVTDHGLVQSPTDHHADLVGWLQRERGLRIAERASSSGDFDARRRRLERCDAVVVIGAHRRAAIHLRGEAGWGTPAALECVARMVLGSRADRESPPLYEAPGVGLVCYRASDGRVAVVSQSGTAIVERRGGDYDNREYRLVHCPADIVGCHCCVSSASALRVKHCSQSSGARRTPRDRPGGALAPDESANADPLGYTECAELAAFVAAGWHTSRQWLEATAGQCYPDFVPQVSELFESSRAGDIIVFAADDWSFHARDPGGHGAPLAGEMRVSVFFRGPDLPGGGRIGAARLVDVTPTLLELIGHSERLADTPTMDGRSLAAELRAAEQNAK